MEYKHELRGSKDQKTDTARQRRHDIEVQSCNRYSVTASLRQSRCYAHLHLPGVLVHLAFCHELVNHLHRSGAQSEPRAFAQASAACEGVPKRLRQAPVPDSRALQGKILPRRIDNRSAQGLSKGTVQSGLWRGGGYLQAVHQGLPLIEDAAHARQQVAPRRQHSLLLRPRQPHSALRHASSGKSDNKVHPLLRPA